MEQIRDLIRSSTVLELGPLPAPRLPATATEAQALKHLVRSRRGAVVAVDGLKPVGIYTERDVLYRLADGSLAARSIVGHDGDGKLFSEVMSQPIVTVRRQATLHDALALMHRHLHRHLVVVDKAGELRGLLTSSDLVQFIADQFPEDVVNLPPRLHQRLARADGA
ncbi:MAG TPA: CBS domain-containing protein [Thermoanaerobaculia bacterium]|nr:CBS domain-containing protein [Thermoanaerobaculia bacterium]